MKTSSKNLIFILTMTIIFYSCKNEEAVFDQNLTSELNKIETIYKEGDIKNEDTLPLELQTPVTKASNAYIHEIQKKLNDSYSKQTTYLKSSGNTVGVIKYGSCGPYQELMVFMDCEDGNLPRPYGWIGDWSWDHNGNVTLRFCVINSAYFNPTVVDYAILNLTGQHSWPYGVNHIEDYIDNEDYRNTNYSTLNNIAYSGQLGNCYFSNNTDLGFYWYKAQTEYNEFPNLGISYGVFGKFGSDRGYLQTADELNRNANFVKRALFNYTTNSLEAAYETTNIPNIIDGRDAQTTMYVCRAK